MVCSHILLVKIQIITMKIEMMDLQWRTMVVLNLSLLKRNNKNINKFFRLFICFLLFAKCCYEV